MNEPTASEYLGDGVTASFDGWQIELSTQRDDAEHRICLDPFVFASLLSFAHDRGLKVLP